MAKQRGFFSWWIGELREVFSGRPVPVHSLVMSSHEVALVEKGVEAPLGVVDLQTEDWREQIEGLRARILGRRGKYPVVEVQLPPEQVLFTRIVVGTDTSNAGKVAEQVSIVSGQPVDAISYDLAAKPDADGSVVVAIAQSSTVIEAARYADGWGFDPVRITSMEAPAAFPRGPDFEHHASRSAGSALPKIVLGAAVLTLILTALAGGRILSQRADVVADVEARAATLPATKEDLQQKQLALVEFAHAAATATDLRDTRMPVWRILAEAASIIPSDTIIDTIEYSTGQVTLRGTTASTVALEESLDRSPVFSAPSLSGTSRSSTGRANFVIEATIDERSVR